MNPNKRKIYQISENNQNIIPTWIMIIYFIHLGVEDLDFTKQSMDYILPLLMAQNFAIRLHAQVRLYNVYCII